MLVFAICLTIYGEAEFSACTEEVDGSSYVAFAAVKLKSVLALLVYDFGILDLFNVIAVAALILDSFSIKIILNLCIGL